MRIGRKNVIQVNTNDVYSHRVDEGKVVITEPKKETAPVDETPTDGEDETSRLGNGEAINEEPSVEADNDVEPTTEPSADPTADDNGNEATEATEPEEPSVEEKPQVDESPQTEEKSKSSRGRKAKNTKE